MPLRATALYAALLTGLFLLLAVRAIQARRRHGVPLGTHHRLVERAVRAHGNCAEYAPVGLVLLGLLEGNGLPLPFVHALGSILLLGRVMHAWGISQEPEQRVLRVWGMALTFSALGAGAAALAGLAFAP